MWSLSVGVYGEIKKVMHMNEEMRTCLVPELQFEFVMIFDTHHKTKILII